MTTLIRAFGVAGFSLLVFFGHDALAGSKEGASSFITALGKTALGTIANDDLSTEKKRTVLRGLFEKNVDIDWIAKFVLGQYWRQATPDQQHEYQKTYKDFLVKNYTTNFTTFKNSTFEVTRAKDGDQAGDYTLTMTIKRPSQEDVHVDYRVREKNGGYRVYDFIVEGVSLITSQRSEFSSVVGRSGIESLIQQIKSKTAEVNTAADSK